MKNMNDQKEALKAIAEAVSKIEKKFGKGSIMKLGDATHTQVSTFSTGSISLDVALGAGGIPVGRIIEVYGPESSGKTTLTLHMIAEVQKQGGIAAFIDAEHALDPAYAQNLGVDINQLYISQPDHGEQALEIAETMVNSQAINLIIVDSVAALVPKAEIDGNMGDAYIGLQARLMSQALRKLTGALNKSNCTVVFINQLREKVGVFYGSAETTPGGRALKFYASVRLDIRKVDSIKNGSELVGNRTRVKVVKNKIAPPFKQAEFDIIFGQGISSEGDILDSSLALGIISRGGSWYSYKDGKLGQGREAAKLFLKENPDVFQDLDSKVREYHQFARDIPTSRISDEDDEENFYDDLESLDESFIADEYSHESELADV